MSSHSDLSRRMLLFSPQKINELPKPSILLKSLRDLNIGTFENIETAKGDTLIIEALNKFVERRISALPIVDDEGKLIDIYAKFDVIVSRRMEAHQRLSTNLDSLSRSTGNEFLCAENRKMKKLVH